MIRILRTVLGLLLLATVVVACRPVVTVKMRTKVATGGATTRETELRRTVDSDNKSDPSRTKPLREFFPTAFGEGFPKRSEDANAISLAGSFPNPEAIPADFERAVDLVNNSSRNKISFKTEDILFGTRYLYRERFADAIEPEDLAKARDELIDQCIRFVRAAARYEFGRDFDTAAFETWVKSDLRKLLVDLMEIYYSERRNFGKKDPHTGEDGFDRAWKRVRARLEHSGLALDADMDAPLNRLLIESWISDQLALQLVRRGATKHPKIEEFKYLFPEKEPWSGLERVMEKTAEQEYGSLEAAQKAFERSLLAVTGTFGSADFDYRFDCAVEMPGFLLRTNGNIESTTSAFWLFEGEDMFPNGVSLELESAVMETDLCARIKELKASLEPRDAVWLISHLEGTDAPSRAEMKKALTECARYGSLAWFDDPALPDPQDRATLKGKLEPILAGLRR